MDRAIADRRPITPVLVDLNQAVARLGGYPDLYKRFYPLLRGKAEWAIAETAWLLAHGLPAQALVTARTLVGMADSLGALSVSIAAREAAHAIDLGTADDDLHWLAHASVALARSCIVIEGQIWAGSAALDGSQRQCHDDAQGAWRPLGGDVRLQRRDELVQETQVR